MEVVGRSVSHVVGVKYNVRFSVVFIPVEIFRKFVTRGGRKGLTRNEKCKDQLSKNFVKGVEKRTVYDRTDRRYVVFRQEVLRKYR